eukprot:10666912-Ditylum_brightwellii.AAC.1
MSADQDKEYRHRTGVVGKKIFYVIAKGPQGGIYIGWVEGAQKATQGLGATLFKGANTFEEALAYYERYKGRMALRFSQDNPPKWAKWRVHPLPSQMEKRGNPGMHTLV